MCFIFVRLLSPSPERGAAPVVDLSVHPPTHSNAHDAMLVVTSVITPPRTGPAAG